MNAVVEYVPSCAKTGRHPLKVVRHREGSGLPHEYEECSECGQDRETIEDDSIPDDISTRYVAKARHYIAWDRGIFGAPRSVGFSKKQAIDRLLQACRERAVIEPEEQRT